MGEDAGQLAGLTTLLRQTPDFDGLVDALAAGRNGVIDGAWGSSSALAAACLSQRCASCLLVILPRPADQDDFAEDLAGFRGGSVDVFPVRETLPGEIELADAVVGRRLRVLRRLLSDDPPRVIVAPIAALLQPVPPRERLQAATRRIATGDQLDQEAFQQWLLDCGFERVTGIQFPGEFAVRGGIVDVFPPDAEEPLRIEFFGDEVESIRQFDAETQRTTQTLPQVDLVVLPTGIEEGSDPANAEASRRSGSRPQNQADDASLFDYLPAKTWVVLNELTDITSEGRQYLERLRDPRGLFRVESILGRASEQPCVTVAPLAADTYATTCHLQIESIERFTGPRTQVLGELAEVIGRDEQVLIACHNEAEQERLSEMLRENAPDLVSRVRLTVGRVSRGFRMVPQRIVVLSDHELFSRTEVRRVARKKKFESRAIDSFIELNEGDYVVHISHGIAKYHGMTVMENHGELEEHLELEFRNEVKLYVPVSLIHLVQKYVGGSQVAPELSPLGGAGWQRKKEKVAEAVADLAADMIELQAAREAEAGIACPPDSHWVQEFDAAFPYTETPDQLSAIADCKSDLERRRPMDRLICGDVGYGKTEVAMRAAFKVLDSGRQVAVLVPTTILAEQHYRSFSERMAEFPVVIESLSRFKTKKEQKQVVEGLKDGSVDLVIGTHRLVSKDVKFKNLGLVIIDEEQRFGVEVKEALKKLRLEVDVLTLSATPIPRTLHFSLLGIRDISNLTTAPQDRQAVTTRICRWDADLIRQAIVRELNRNGQVFFVHNRVYNIYEIEQRLKQIVPEARYDVAHGQMTPDELEGAMLRFVRAETDVLVCTTIVESGVDIPNANTMFIHQAENYGLADLHQLRGRVGRYKHRAYCYLLLEEGKTLTDTAAKRLKAIEEFSELGAGFKIAMRDLEIRGAGNLLGTEQSGHIATVGYELYCQILENAVRRLKKQPVREHQHVALELPVTAFLPTFYVPSGKPKIEVYRRLTQLGTIEELRDFEKELKDRFGEPPEEARRLLQLQEVAILAKLWRLSRIYLEDGFIVFRYQDRRYMNLLKSRFEKTIRIVDEKQAVAVLRDRTPAPEKLLHTLKQLLQPFSGRS